MLKRIAFDLMQIQPSAHRMRNPSSNIGLGHRLSRAQRTRPATSAPHMKLLFAVEATQRSVVITAFGGSRKRKPPARTPGADKTDPWVKSITNEFDYHLVLTKVPQKEISTTLYCLEPFY